MSLVSFESATKYFGARKLFENVSFALEDGEKLGLIGRNGAGKTTIFRMILGEETPDTGSIHKRGDLRIGVVDQSPSFAPGATLFEEAMSGLHEIQTLEKEYHEIAEKLATETGESAHDKLLHRMDEVQHRIEFLGGFDYHHRVETVLEGLELPRDRWDTPAERLSGGEKSRLSLARVLVAGFDLLLLDEPTNHLDYRGVEWLEEFLKTYNGAMIAVSHDRRFLDGTVSAILDLEHGRLIRYDGNYTKSREQKIFNDDVLRRAVANQQSFIDKEMDFIRRNMGSQRTAEAKGRLKRLKRLEVLDGPKGDARGPKIRFGGARGGDVAFDARDLSFGFGDRILFSHLDCLLQRGERLAVIGPNGAGKTSFLKCLVGQLKPTEGFLKLGSNATPGYYDQNLTGLNESKSIIEEIHGVRRDLTEEQVRDHLGRFLFSGDDVEKEIRMLSGGERARVLLAKLVLMQHTFLILDEPTNHLDIKARESLEDSLDGYEGAIVVVSHDRQFLDNVCDRVLEIEDGKTQLYPGGYSEYAERKRRQRDEASRAAREREVNERERQKREQQKEKERQEKRDKSSPQSRESKPESKRKNSFKLQQLEEQISALELQAAEAAEAMTLEENYRDAAKMKELQKRHADLTREVAYLYNDWEKMA
ncbi:MAG: ATP-binding cassette domain-containing protein [Planctomycetes bacterium]|nr:ATP-binding cassette domain-containing protein [Planctomycetota bacterium]